MSRTSLGKVLKRTIYESNVDIPTGCYRLQEPSNKWPNDCHKCKFREALILRFNFAKRIEPRLFREPAKSSCTTVEDPEEMLERRKLAHEIHDTYVCELVSGRKKARNTHVTPDSHIRIHIVHVHPSDCAAKPPMTGRHAGPDTAATPQSPTTTARHSSVHISAKLAPPVSRAGLPATPARNLRGSNAPKFLLSAVGS